MASALEDALVEVALDVRAVGLVMSLWAAGSMLGAWGAGRLAAIKKASESERVCVLVFKSVPPWLAAVPVCRY
jgi:hypothetical protein